MPPSPQVRGEGWAKSKIEDQQQPGLVGQFPKRRPIGRMPIGVGGKDGARLGRDLGFGLGRSHRARPIVDIREDGRRADDGDGLRRLAKAIA
jgi:hypothetical protein